MITQERFERIVDAIPGRAGGQATRAAAGHHFMADHCRLCEADFGLNNRINHRHCQRCEKDLLRRGLCKWCGERSRKGRTQTCEACEGSFQDGYRLDRDVRPDGATAKYRGQDAKENQWDTKHG